MMFGFRSTNKKTRTSRRSNSGLSEIQRQVRKLLGSDRQNLIIMTSRG